MHIAFCAFLQLQSARSVWRQSVQSCQRQTPQQLQSARSVWRQRQDAQGHIDITIVAICTERVEAKAADLRDFLCAVLQSARSVWRQRDKAYSYFRDAVMLQSARSVWRQRMTRASLGMLTTSCNLRGACGGKELASNRRESRAGCNLRGACGGKGTAVGSSRIRISLQSARSVWRQSFGRWRTVAPGKVAICAERVEAKG